MTPITLGTLLTYNWFWFLLFGSVGLAALIVLLIIVYQLMRIAAAIEYLAQNFDRKVKV